MLVVLYPSAEFSLSLKGKLLLYMAEGVSVMMGALQRNFLLSVRCTEKFVFMFRFLLPALAASLLPSSLSAPLISVTSVRSSEKIALLLLDVHKEQIRVTRAFFPLQHGMCLLVQTSAVTVASYL